MKIEQISEREQELELLSMARETLKMTNQRSGHHTFQDWLHIFKAKWTLVSFSDEHILELENWYKNVAEQNYINTIPGEWEEVIIHKDQRMQIFGPQSVVSDFLDLSGDDFQLSLECLALRYNQEWNLKKPFVSFTANNYRFSLTLHSLSPQNNSKLFVRRGSSHSFPLESFCQTSELAGMLRGFVKNKKNVVICGATGSGKTSFLKSLLEYLPKYEHIVILEDAHEIKVQHPHLTHLLSQPSLDSDGYNLKDFCSYALRMRPDRIILGEMRSTEIIPFVSAMNTGHRGLLSTLHADSAPDALSRLALLFQLHSENKGLGYNLILSLVAQAIDYIVFVKDKKIDEIISVFGSTNGNNVYDFVFKKDDDGE